MIDYYQRIIQFVRENKPAALQTTLHGYSGSIKEDMTRKIIPVIPSVDKHGRYSVKVTSVLDGEVLTLTEPVLPPERLIILGGGHVALSVCLIGARCGFNVCVVDDRSDFANEERFPEAQTVICDDFSAAIRKLSVSSFDYVVVITRGHRSDADCLRVLLSNTFPAYLGMIGSKRRVKGMLEMLRAEGFDHEKLNRICTPIGLNIGAVTPDEIAVSIMAEIISYRHMPEFGANNHFYNNSDAEISVFDYLAVNTDPKAIVTVIETKGSVPRGTGAKMVVDHLGKTVGSIGGGCTESAAIQGAKMLIRTGRYEIIDVDLTGDVAEFDGMVCGGTMKILIEDASVL